MSYEGYVEFICSNGHYWSESSMTFTYGTSEEIAAATKCEHCKQQAKYSCDVDETNGPDKEYPHTLPGPKEFFGTGKIKRIDDKGIAYLDDIDLYYPKLDSDRWNTEKPENV